MAKSNTVQSDPVAEEVNVSGGIKRDMPRSAIPQGSVYDATDFLLYQPGVAIKRGGTSYAGPAFAAGSYAIAAVYAPFPAGNKLVGVNNSGALYTVTSGTTTSLGGSTVASIIDRPKLRIGGSSTAYLIFPVADGSTSPVAWDGSTAPATLGGTPPAGKVCEIYKTRLVLGNQSSTPQRLYFSPTPSITSTWDTTNSWIDTSYPVTALASLSNCLLIFSSGHTERITGSTPPPNTDMTLYPLGDIGCTDARSITIIGTVCAFASPRGVYITNGIAPVCLTKEGGIETYWQSLFTSYDPSTWIISAGVYRSSFLIFSILDNSGNLVDCLMCNVPSRSWWRCTNIKATMFTSATNVKEELYFADRGAARVNTISGIFTPGSGNINDADGTAVAPTLEFRALGQGTGVKSFGFGRVSYFLNDPGAHSPTIAVTGKLGLRASVSFTPPESPLAANSDVTRKRFSLARDAQALTVRLAQSGPSANTEVYGLEVEQRPYPLTEEGVS